MFLAVRIFQGLLAGFVPASIALVATNTPDEKTGYALGIMSTAGATGSILGPLVGGVVSHYFGNREAFLFSSAIVLVSALVAVFLREGAEFQPESARSHVLDDLKHALSNRTFAILLTDGGDQHVLRHDPGTAHYGIRPADGRLQGQRLAELRHHLLGGRHRDGHHGAALGQDRPEDRLREGAGHRA